MTNYWDKSFLKHLNIDKVKVVFEVGARYGCETIELKKTFRNSIIHSFECNPKTIDICRKKLSNRKDIIFNDFGLGKINELRPFYSYIRDNDGASSLLKRIDFNATQINTGTITIKTLHDYVNNNNIKNIDILCMDVQGYELNILKGCRDFIKNINCIIMEEPKPIINTYYLPNGIHSKYINAPTSQQIKLFMKQNGFVEIERIEENKIEDNVMYRRKILHYNKDE